MLTLAALALLLQGYPPEKKEDPPPIDLRIRGEFLTLSGDVLATDDGLAGTTVEFDRDFDLEKNEGVFSGLLRAELSADVRLYLDYWQGDFEGDTATPDGFVYGGSIYPAGATVRSDFTFKIPTFSFGLPVRLFEDKEEDIRVDLEAGLGLKYLYLLTSVKAENTPVPFTERTRVGVPLPVVALRLEAQLGGWFRMDLFASGLSLNDIGDASAASFEFGIDFRVHVYRGLYFSAGYHVFSISIDQQEGGEDLEVDAVARGFHFGIGVEF